MSKSTTGLLLTGTLIAVLLTACSGDKASEQQAASSAQATAPASQPGATQPSGSAPGTTSTPMSGNPHSGTQPGNTQAGNTQSSNTMAPANAPATAAATNLPSGGKVLRAMHAGGYTYMQVENDGRQFWVASNMINVKHEDHVSWASAALMKDFKSTSLRRTFNEILFVSSVKIDQ